MTCSGRSIAVGILSILFTFAGVCNCDVRTYTRVVKKTCDSPVIHTLLINDVVYCMHVARGGGGLLKNSEFLIASLPFLALDKTQECKVNFECADDRDVVFSADGTNYRCTCMENLGEVDGKCEPCGPQQFSPMYSNRCFTCPEHTTLHKNERHLADVAHDVNDVKYCQANTGYRLIEMFTSIADLLYTNSQRSMYTAEPCEKCYKQIVCNDRFTIVADSSSAVASVCEPGSYQPQASRKRCIPCPRPFYCTGDSGLLTCPQNEHTVEDGASSSRACMCEGAGFFREPTTQLCGQIQNTIEYSPPCMSDNQHIRNWCEDKYTCEPLMRCQKGVLSFCPIGTFMNMTSQSCATCPRGFFCASGDIEACPRGATTVGTMSLDVTYCHCLDNYTHLVDTRLAAGFSCHVSGTGLRQNKQIAVEHTQFLSETSVHQKMVFHIKKRRVDKLSSESGILSINTETRDIYCVFMHHDNTVATDTALPQDAILRTVKYKMTTNDFPIINSEIVSATLDNTYIPTHHHPHYTIRLQMMIANRYDGIVYTGVVTGSLHSTGTFVATEESWTLQYKFGSIYSYTLFALPAMHMIFAIHRTSSLIGSSNLRYNIIMIHEHDGLAPILTVNQSMSENNAHENNTRITPNSNYTAITVDVRNTFQTQVSIYPWQILRHDSPPLEMPAVVEGSPEISSLQGLRLSSGIEIDIFDAFRHDLMFFSHASTQRFGLVRVKYSTCGKHQFTHSLSNFVCECDHGYTKQNHANECVVCDATKEICCRTRDDCAKKRFRCDAGSHLLPSGSCLLCRGNVYCLEGQKFHCPENSVNIQVGSFNISSCICNPGYFLRHSQCTPCPSHFFCNSNQIHQCPANMQTTTLLSKSITECQCSPGFWSYDGNRVCEEVTYGQYWYTTDTVLKTPAVNNCPEKTTTRFTKSIGAGSCKCEAGYKFDSVAKACATCVESQEACLFDSHVVLCRVSEHQKPSHRHDQCVCANGYYDTTAHDNSKSISCAVCPHGYYCSSDEKTQIVKCPVDMTSPAGSPSSIFCTCETSEQTLVYSKATNSSECRCDSKFYVAANRCVQCPLHMHVLEQDPTQLQRQGIQTCVCMDGYMLAATGCVACEVGYVCDNRVEQLREACPFGRFSPISGLHSTKQCLWCGTDDAQHAATNTVTEWKTPRTTPLTCMGGFVAIDSPGHVNVLTSVFKFSVNTDVLKVGKIRGFLSTIFKTESYDITYQYNNNIQFTINMHAEFVHECMSLLLTYPNIWEQIVLASKEHSMTYVYVAHGIFCSVFSAVVKQLYPSESMGSFCYVPFHPSKFSIYPSVQTIITEFMDKKQILFPDVQFVIPGTPFAKNILLSRELVQIHNIFNAVTTSDKQNRIVIMPVREKTLAVFPDHPQTDLSTTKTRDFQNILMKQLPGVADFPVIELAVCDSAVHGLYGECTASFHDPLYVFCSYCEPGISFFSPSEQKCMRCSARSTALCSACCQTKDVSCVEPADTPTSQQLCGNSIHDFSEECDSTDTESPLHMCCTNCKLDTGFYSDPPCTTRCGDFVVAAGVEECDSPGDFSCDMYQCKNVTRNNVKEL